MPLDAIQPGATALTRTGAHSSAAVSVKLSMPARAAPEWPMPGMPPHMSAMMLTIAPPFGCAAVASTCRAGGRSFSIHWLTHSRANRKPPVRLLRTTVSQPLALIADSGAVELAAGVVDERVDAAVTREHGRDRRLHLRLLADVADVGRADAAGVLDLALHRRELVGLAADDGDRGAERRQLVRGAAADPRAAAGDQRDLAAHQAGREDRSVGGHGRKSTDRLGSINQAAAW